MNVGEDTNSDEFEFVDGNFIMMWIETSEEEFEDKVPLDTSYEVISEKSKKLDKVVRLSQSVSKRKKRALKAQSKAISCWPKWQACY